MCRYGVGCAYIHGETCDYCGQASLHPTHLDQRRAHLAECLQEHERNMELSFAVARSKEKTCGICMEVVLDKQKGEARSAGGVVRTKHYPILSNVQVQNPAQLQPLLLPVLYPQVEASQAVRTQDHPSVSRVQVRLLDCRWQKENYIF